MFDPPCHKNARWVKRNEFDSVSYVVAPQPGIGTKHHGILHPTLHLSNGQSWWILLKILARWNELEENTIAYIQQHAFHIRGLLEREEALRGGVQFHPWNLEPQQLFEPLRIRAIRHAAVDKEGKVGEHLLDSGFASVRKKTFEVHLHPRRDAAHQPQVFFASLFHNGLHLVFPILDAIGLPRRQAVALQIARDMMRHNATEPAQRHPSWCGPEFRAALQEDHFAVDKRSIPGPSDVSQQGIARAANVVGHAVLRQGNVLGP